MGQTAKVKLKREEEEEEELEEVNHKASRPISQCATRLTNQLATRLHNRRTFTETTSPSISSIATTVGGESSLCHEVGRL